jgi:hypothetical protein
MSLRLNFEWGVVDFGSETGLVVVRRMKSWRDGGFGGRGVHISTSRIGPKGELGLVLVLVLVLVLCSYRLRAEHVAGSGGSCTVDRYCRMRQPNRVEPRNKCSQSKLR